MNLTIEDFKKVDIRKGTIKEAKLFEEAKNPSLKLWIDFGKGIGFKKSSAQITDNYTTENLIGLEVLAVVNFIPMQIGNFISEVLILGFQDGKGGIVLAIPDGKVMDGSKLI